MDGLHINSMSDVSFLGTSSTFIHSSGDIQLGWPGILNYEEHHGARDSIRYESFF